MSDAWRCHICGEVIGVYEPLVRLLDGHAFETSRALELDSAERSGGVYHRVCFERLKDDSPATSQR